MCSLFQIILITVITIWRWLTLQHNIIATRPVQNRFNNYGEPKTAWVSFSVVLCITVINFNFSIYAFLPSYSNLCRLRRKNKFTSKMRQRRQYRTNAFVVSYIYSRLSKQYGGCSALRIQFKCLITVNISDIICIEISQSHGSMNLNHLKCFISNIQFPKDYYKMDSIILGIWKKLGEPFTNLNQIKNILMKQDKRTHEST